MLGLLLAKLIFSGYSRKVTKLDLEKNLSELQKAVLLARYYLPRKRIVVKQIIERVKGQSLIDLEDYLEKLDEEAKESLNLLIRQVSTCPWHDRVTCCRISCPWYSKQLFFNLEDFKGLKLDRQIARKLFKWSLSLLRYLIVSPQLVLNVVVRSWELLKRGLKKLSFN